MSQHDLIKQLEQDQLKESITDFAIGDTIRVHIRIIEGDKERIQMFQGTVIARKGQGLSETFSLHRVSYGEGMERVFLLHSPRIAKIEVVKRGKVARAKLYYLRGKTGKSAKVSQMLGAPAKAKAAAAKAAAALEAAEKEVAVAMEKENARLENDLFLAGTAESDAPVDSTKE